MDIYDNIDRIAKQQNLSRRQLAIKANIPPSTLSSAFYRKSDLSASALASVANALGVSVSDLLALDEDAKAIKHSIAEDVSKTTGQDVTEIESWLLENELDFVHHEIATTAMEAADTAILSAYARVSDSYLCKTMLDSYASLNRRGRIEAVNRVCELEESGRYRETPPPDKTKGG